MRKALVVSVIVLLAACIGLPCACRKIDSEKESIIIVEEPLCGDPAAASGITLQMATCLDDYRHFYISRDGWNVRWDTVYDIGVGKEAESVFAFSFRKTGQVEVQGENYIECMLKRSFGTAYGDDSSEAIPLDHIANYPLPEVYDVAGRTAAGEERIEIISLSDYYEYYPVEEFKICSGQGKNITNTPYGSGELFLTDFFHIPPGGDTAEVAVKNEENDVTRFHIYTRQVGGVLSASAIGERGGYYVYCCTDEDGNYEDRGQNKGIFYIPCQWENGGRNVSVDWRHIRKVCDQPEGLVPLKMMLDEVRGRLFLVLHDEKEFWLAVYTLEGEVPVLVQQIPVMAGCEREDGMADSPYFRQMTVEEGGILLTWRDNSFAFIAEENGRYRLWYGGKFPADGRDEMILSQAPAGGDGLLQFQESRAAYAANRQYPDIRQNIQGENESFTVGNACFFDGERLVLAAMTTWEHPDVLLSVYHEDGLAYCGLYKVWEADRAYTWFAQVYTVPQRYGEKECIRIQGRP